MGIHGTAHSVPAPFQLCTPKQCITPRDFMNQADVLGLAKFGCSTFRFSQAAPAGSLAGAKTGGCNQTSIKERPSKSMLTLFIRNSSCSACWSVSAKGKLEAYAAQNRVH
eukprot:628327-Pelagomonas_calceolata.AAC.1